METPKLRFKEFDGDWDTSKIDKIASVTSGGTPSRANPEYWNGDIPWVTTSLVDFNVIHSAEEFITKEGVNNSSAKLFPKNTILMAMYGQGITRGKVAILGIEATTNQACCAIKLKDGYETQFIFQNLMNRYDEIRDLSNDGGQKNLSAGIIKDIEISIPSKGEQTKIATFLSAVDEKISQLTQKHQLLSQYKQGMMQKIFSQQIRFKADDGSEFEEWESKSIKDIADVKGGKRIPKGYSLLNENTGHPYITVSDMNRSYSIDSTKIKYVPLEVVDTIKRYTITDKDVFISVAGTLGIIGKIPTEFNGANLTENADKLTNLKCHQDFLIYLLDSGYLAELIESTATTSAQPKLALYAIEQLEIQIPCLAEQTKIANFLSTIDQKIEVTSQQIEQAKQWKKGLLQQMFV